MMGSQWNTSGGSFGFLRNICRMRFHRIAITTIEAPVSASFSANSESPVIAGEFNSDADSYVSLIGQW